MVAMGNVGGKIFVIDVHQTGWGERTSETQSEYHYKLVKKYSDEGVIYGGTMS